MTISDAVMRFNPPTHDDDGRSVRLVATCLAAAVSPRLADHTLDVADTFADWLGDADDVADEKARRLLLAAVCTQYHHDLERHQLGDLMSHLKQLYIFTVRHL